jgi:hypothetical protein
VTRTVGQLFISLYGDLHNAQSEVIVRFRDSNGQPKDVGEVKTDLSMNLPGGHGHAFQKRRKQDEYSGDLSSEAPTSDGGRLGRESFVEGRSRRRTG